jgi:hypothetical protein
LKHTFVLTVLLFALPGALAVGAADPLAFSDPANTPPPPAHAIGFPSRDPQLDVVPGFRNPPPGYGEVAFYWWLGDPLTKERLAWQIEKLAKAKGVMGLQINYAHSDRGGKSWGLTYPSDPPLFSQAWWELVGWFMQEAKRHGMAISLSDYTLGFGQGWSVDDVLREHPELAGMTLRMNNEGQVVPETVPLSLNPMHPLSGKLYAEKFFGQFEQHYPGEGGKGLNFFFSDELGFGVGGNLWWAHFADEFQKRKGYDITPELPALFKDIGPRTPKVRLDYRDVVVALSEVGFFKPCFDWHQQRGMIFGCDHGGRGRNVVEFGDYFRTQRWNQGPGCDQPGLGRDLIKNKVASSIAHLYQRPRVWLEGYYGSGWGTNTEQLTDATFANFAQGQNLLTLHGLYYSTHGGYWEWAPPCNHFRMPYWAHMDRYLAMVERLSYLLSQGYHRCDVAVIYPVAPMEAGLGGQESVDAAFEAGRQLYARGMDFDFIDFESLARAQVEEKDLRVSGERYRALVLPAMRAVRWSTLARAVEFQRAGGVVIVLGALPEASDRVGRDDPELNALVAQLTTRVENPDQVAALVEKAGTRDFAVLSPESIAPNFMHRVIGPRDVFMVHNAPQDAECWFRAIGKAELWDPWTGETRPLPVLSQTADGTRLRLPLTAKEAHLIVFSPGQPQLADASRSNAARSTIPLDGDWEFELQPTLDNRFGDYHWPPTQTFVGAEARQFRYADETAPNPGWESPDFDDSKWTRVTHSFGPKFWKLGPLPPNADLDAQLAALAAVDPAVPLEFGGKQYRWQPYEFSWRWGVEGDPGHQGYHGLKGNVTDHFLCLGARKSGRNEFIYGPEPAGTRYYLWSAVAAAADGTGYAITGGLRPTAVWLNHQSIAKPALTLKRGANPLLLRYNAPGRGFFVVRSSPPAPPEVSGEFTTQSVMNTLAPFTNAASWIWYPEQAVAGDRWFRKAFQAEKTPKPARLRITCDNGYSVSLNGRPVGRGSRWETVQEYDVTKHLRAGRNLLEVRATNTGDSAGLIAELTDDGLCVATDATWRCAKSESAAENDWVAVQVVSNFADSLWAKHQHGPPRLEAAAPAPAAQQDEANRPASQPAPLAMRWFGDASVLPFDTRPQIAQSAGWYRFRAAPGLRVLTVPTSSRIHENSDAAALVGPGEIRPNSHEFGHVQAWSNGKAIPGKRLATGWRFELPEPAKTAAMAALRIQQPRGCYGGAAIPAPITQDCVPGTVELGDWSKIDGLTCYSGGACYRRTVELTPEQARGQVTLDLGKLVSSAEVRVNGQVAGIRVAPPWRVELSKQVKAGQNRIEVLVYNTLANHYVTIPTHYRGDLTSGLLGPATLEVTPE